MVFAIESADRANHGLLKGTLMIGAEDAEYEMAMYRQGMEWVLPAVLGERCTADGAAALDGHPNVLTHSHAFMGSPQLLMPWLDVASLSESW